MSLYSPNNNTPFIFVAALLLVLLLLMIPLRPSNWNKEKELVEQTDSLNLVPIEVADSLPIPIAPKLDTQIQIVPATDTSIADTNLVISPITPVVPPSPVDTAVTPPIVPNENPPSPVEPTTEPTVQKADSSILGMLFFSFLFFLLFAVIIYKIITARWQKKYWLQYNATLQPLGSLQGVDSLEIDFNGLEEALKDKKNSKKDIEPISEPLVDTEVIPAPIIPEPEPKEIKASVVTKDVKTEDTPIVTTPTTPPLSFSEMPIVQLFVELTTRPFRIVWAISKGLISIVTYFFVDSPSQSQKLDFKWQDAVSFIMIPLFLLCQSTMFPFSPNQTTWYGLMLVLLWLIPSGLRLHWGWGVLGIFAIIGEFIALVVHAILEATKNLEPSTEPTDYTYLYAGVGMILCVGLIIWAKAQGKFDGINFSKVTALALALGAGYFIYYPYFEHGFVESFELFGLGDLLARAILVYAIYEFFAATFEYYFKKKKLPKDKPTPISTPIIPQKQAVVVDSPATVNYTKPLTDEELKQLFKMNEWWKKVDLHLLDTISMPNAGLMDESEFIVLYLPDCINTTHLHLYGNEFETVPFEITELEQLELLNLSYNKIEVIDTDISYLEKLHTLNLSHNEITTVPDEITNLKELTLLDLTGNPLSAQSIAKLKKQLPFTTIKFDAPVEEVNTIENEIAPTDLIEKIRLLLAEELKDPNAVTSIWSALDGKELSDLPASIFKLFNNLKEFSLFRNNFTALPEVIFDMTKLNNLNLAYNQITSIPDEIAQLNNLKTLTLHGNPIEYFSPHCTSLERLYFDYAQLKAFPPYLLNMKDLRFLSLTGNDIPSIPDEIVQLNKLETLEIGYNSNLEINFEHLAKLPELSRLHLGSVGLDNTKQPTGLNLLSNQLIHLDLSSNSFTTIPEEVLSLSKLESLSLGHNSNLDNNFESLSTLPTLSSLNINSTKLNDNRQPLGLKSLKNLAELRLSYNQFTKIPADVYGLTQLKSLVFVDNEIDQVAPEIGQLTDLFYLNFDKNKLHSLPKEIKNLQNLYTLSINDNFITDEELTKIKAWLPNTDIRCNTANVSLEEEVGAPPVEEIALEIENNEEEIHVEEDKNNVAKVKKLLAKELADPSSVRYTSSLMQQGLDDLPISIMRQFNNLGSILLHSNNFKEIPKAVYHLPALKNLFLPFNQIEEVPDKISSLVNLEELDLSGNPVKVFSPKLVEMSHLRKLRLSGVGLTSVPVFLLKMKQLQALDLSSNHLLRIPENIKDLTNLAELNLDFTGLSEMPAPIFELNSLKHLSWTGNQLKELSPNILKLNKLERLSIGYNREMQLSDELLSSMPRLKELFLSGMGFNESTNFDFGKLENLEELWLSNNTFQKIPRSIFSLKKLRTLSLSNNQLTNIPEFIGELSNLTYLYLDKNQLTNLPIAIKSLKKLRKIYLSGNEISIKTKKKIQRNFSNIEIEF